MGYRLTIKEKGSIIKLYSNWKNTKEIGNILNRDSTTIWRYLKNKGLNRSRGEVKKGIKNPMWKDKVTYRALHDWVSRNKSKDNQCKKCGKKSKRLELSNISGKLKRDIKDYEWLCVRCHRQKDSNSRMINGQFKVVGKNNQSGVVGICFNNRDKRWVANIGVNGKQIYLISSKDKLKVIKARKEAEKNIKKMICRGIRG